MNDYKIKNNATIIFTTHSMTEANRANVIGFMRKGKILCEENPGVIKQKFNLNSFGEIFVVLSRQQQIENEDVM